MKVSSLWFTCTILLVLVLVQETRVAHAQACNPIQMSPCLSTIQKGSKPTQQCCSAVQKQKPCLCQYMKNPTFKTYLNSPNAKKISTTCKVPFPKC